MQYKKIKNTDLNVSNLCLGTAPFGEKISREAAFEILDTYVRATAGAISMPGASGTL